MQKSKQLYEHIERETGRSPITITDISKAFTNRYGLVYTVYYTYDHLILNQMKRLQCKHYLTQAQYKQLGGK